MTKKKNKKLSLAGIAINLVCTIMSISCIYPLFWMGYTSLKTKGEFIQDTLSFPVDLQFYNYVKAFEIGNLWQAMTNSMINVIINVVVVCVLATINGYFFSRVEFKGKKIIYGCYVIGFLIPIYGMLVPVFTQYKLLGLVNKRASLWISYYAMQIPLATFLVESFIRGIPRAIEEAAAIEGCTLWDRIWKVIFPLCIPIISTVAILTALITWNEFGFAAVLITRPELRTISIAVRSFTSGLDLQYTYLIAALTSASIPIIAIYLAFSRQIINGVTASAVKG